MVIKTAEFVKSAVTPQHYPPEDLPEIAFAGRSNVGKSSLINKILNRKNLVKTSNTPGRTQLINFFNINESFTFVDLPGYGYAKVPEAVKKKWGPMIETYLINRVNLKGIVLIIDIRRVPQQEELNFIEWLNHYNISYIIVLTKADKLSKNKQTKQCNAIVQKLNLNNNPLIFSAKSGQGKENIWKSIKHLLNLDQDL